MTSGCNVSIQKKSQKEHFTNREFQISELQQIKKISIFISCIFSFNFLIALLSMKSLKFLSSLPHVKDGLLIKDSKEVKMNGKEEMNLSASRRDWAQLFCPNFCWYHTAKSVIVVEYCLPSDTCWSFSKMLHQKEQKESLYYSLHPFSLDRDLLHSAPQH